MQQFYFNLNLNKFGELRQQIETEKRTFNATAIAYGIILVIVTVIVMVLNFNLSNKIENRKTLLKDIKEEIKTYEVSGDFLSSKDLERLARVSTERIFWSKKLVAISEKTTDKIAITHFSFKGGHLSLYGITKLDKGQKEFDLINNFINELKSNEQINIDFPDIQFVKSVYDIEKDVEILRFQIDCIAKDSGKKGGRS